jgi:hypothetical protein
MKSQLSSYLPFICSVPAAADSSFILADCKAVGPITLQLARDKGWPSAKGL